MKLLHYLLSSIKQNNIIQRDTQAYGIVSINMVVFNLGISQSHVKDKQFLGQ